MNCWRLRLGKVNFFLTRSRCSLLYWQSFLLHFHLCLFETGSQRTEIKVTIGMHSVQLWKWLRRNDEEHVIFFQHAFQPDAPPEMKMTYFCFFTLRAICLETWPFIILDIFGLEVLIFWFDVLHSPRRQNKDTISNRPETGNNKSLKQNPKSDLKTWNSEEFQVPASFRHILFIL